VEANTSDYATRRVLSTKCEDGKWRLIAFISKLLNATEQNLTSTGWSRSRVGRSPEGNYSGIEGFCKGDWSGRLQEIPQLITIYKV